MHDQATVQFCASLPKSTRLELSTSVKSYRCFFFPLSYPFAAFVILSHFSFLSASPSIKNSRMPPRRQITGKKTGAAGAPVVKGSSRASKTAANTADAVSWNK